MLSHARIGEAWEARSTGERPEDYVRIKIDDPDLLAPFNAALFPLEDRGSAQLVWSRRRPADD